MLKIVQDIFISAQFLESRIYLQKYKTQNKDCLRYSKLIVLEENNITILNMHLCDHKYAYNFTNYTEINW